MTALGEVLELLHATPRWTTLSLEGRDWRHHERNQAAFHGAARHANGPGTDTTLMVFEPATPRQAVETPPTSEQHWRLWDEPPERARVEFDLGHETITAVFDGPTWWSWSPSHGGQTNGGRPNSTHGRGPGGHLTCPARLLPALHLEVIGDGELCGRRTHRLVATLRSNVMMTRMALAELGYGADDYLLDVDAERGVILRAEARIDGEPFRIVEASRVAFDEPLDAGIFILDAADGSGFYLPAVPRDVDIEDLEAEIAFTVWLIGGWDGRPQVRVRPFGRDRDDPEVVHVVYLLGGLNGHRGAIFLTESSRRLEQIPETATMIDGITVHETVNDTQRRVRAFLTLGETHIQLEASSCDVAEVVALAKRLVPSAEISTAL